MTQSQGNLLDPIPNPEAIIKRNRRQQQQMQNPPSPTN